MVVDYIKTIVSTLARSDESGVIRGLQLLLVLRMLPVPWHSAPCSHAIVVGDWLICTLMDWILLRIFFWWPARVTPILSRSLEIKRQRGRKLKGRRAYLKSQMKGFPSWKWIIWVWSDYTVPKKKVRDAFTVQFQGGNLPALNGKLYYSREVLVMHIALHSKERA